MLKRIAIIFGSFIVLPILITLFGEFIAVRPGSICELGCSTSYYFVWGLLGLSLASPIVVIYLVTRYIVRG
jgi:hypothetical protein